MEELKTAKVKTVTLSESKLAPDGNLEPEANTIPLKSVPADEPEITKLVDPLTLADTKLDRPEALLIASTKFETEPASLEPVERHSS